MITIYKITNIVSEKIYIGKTKQKLSKRISEHFNLLRNNKHYNKYIQSSYNKYGKDSFSIESIDTCEEKDWIQKEIFWIKKFKSNDKNFGYNLTKGGEGGNGRVVSQEEINILIERNINRVWTKEMKDKISKHTLEFSKIYWTEEKRKEAGERSKKYGKRGGWKLSEEFKNKRRKAMTGFIHSEKTKNKLKELRKSTSKSVKCVETGKIYISLKEAARDIGTNASNIRSHLQGKLKTVKKLTFIWN